MIDKKSIKQQNKRAKKHRGLFCSAVYQKSILRLILVLSFLLSSSLYATSNKCSTAIRPVSLKEKLNFYNPFNLFKGRSIGAIELLGEDFYQASPKGSVVGISGYKGFRARLNKANGEFLSGKYFADGEKVFHKEVDSGVAMVNYLLQVYEKSGPIYRLAILGHGSPGTITLGSERVNTFWTNTHKKSLGNLPKDLFAQNAEIVIVNCNCTRGTFYDSDRGIRNTRAIFSNFASNGARVIAARTHVRANTAGYEESPIVLETRDRVNEAFNKPYIKAVILPMLLFMIPKRIFNNIKNAILLDERSKFESIDIIDIPAENSSPKDSQKQWEATNEYKG